jgi:para-nitrobenzyl esterase
VRTPARAALFAQATTDAEFTCKSRSVALALSAAQREPVYRYLFDQPLENDPPMKALGATHTGEHPFLFAWQGTYHPSDTDRAVQSRMVGYWTRMAKTGDPNGQGDPEWPAVSNGDDAYLQIGADTEARQGSPNARCDFWGETPLLWLHI